MAFAPATVVSGYFFSAPLEGSETAKVNRISLAARPQYAFGGTIKGRIAAYRRRIEHLRRILPLGWSDFSWPRFRRGRMLFTSNQDALAERCSLLVGNNRIRWRLGTGSDPL